MMVCHEGYEFDDGFEIYSSYDNWYLETEHPCAVTKRGHIYYGYVHSSVYKGEKVHVFCSTTYDGVIILDTGKTLIKCLKSRGLETKESKIERIKRDIAEKQELIRKIEEEGK